MSPFLLHTHNTGGLAQSVECVVSNDEAPGSKPGFSIFAEHPCEASIAQMVERKTLNLVVVGSIPTGGVFCQLNKWNHQSVGYNTHDWVAEWSKALDLSSSGRKSAWVRTPLQALFFLIRSL